MIQQHLPKIFIIIYQLTSSPLHNMP